MKSDIQIAQEAQMLPIAEVGAQIGLSEEALEAYGKYKAKVDLNQLQHLKKKAKLVLVTAINPTPAGEGKTTTSIGLADAIHRLGKKSVLALREPSLGPVFGLKGGAAGGGYAQVLPMEDINLHFTGDFHAIGAANNLLAARRRYERPGAPTYGDRPGESDRRHPQRRFLSDYRRLGDHGHFLPLPKCNGSEGAALPHHRRLYQR